MKKLMVVASAVILGSSAFGAAVEWNLKQGEDALYAPSTYVGTENKGTPVSSGTLYLFYASYAQADLYSALKDGTALSSLAGTYGVKAANGTDTFSTSIGTDGKIANTTFMADVVPAGTDAYKQSFYEVVKVGDEYWIGATMTDLSWNTKTQGDASPSWSTAGRSARDHRLDTSYSAQGWYTVPEPTSGLLLLLGVAGLALKRRRA